MADKKAAAASGADPTGDAARRRNVPGYTIPGALAQRPELDEKFHGKKKVQIHPYISLHAIVNRCLVKSFLGRLLANSNLCRKLRCSIYLTNGNLSLHP